MYTISVPISNNNQNSKEKTLEELRRAGASRVFLAIGTVSFDENKRKKVLEWLKENIEYYKENGLETGVWFWALWRSDIDKAKKMQKITAFEGFSAESNNTAFFCPSDKDFIDDTCDFIKKIAELHPDIIMFDDDFRYGNLSTGFGCCCDNHLKMLSQKSGETITRDKIAVKMFSGFFSIFKLESFIAYFFIGIVVETVSTSVLFWTPTYLKESLGFSSATAGLIFSAMSFAKAFSPFLSLLFLPLFKNSDMKLCFAMFLISIPLFIFMLFIGNSWINIVIFIIAIVVVGIAGSTMWSVYIPSLAKSGKVSGVNGILDCVAILELRFQIWLLRIL